MGLAASVAREQMLTARNSDLIFKIQQFTEKVQALGQQSVNERFISKNPGDHAAQERQKRIQQLEKAYTMQLELSKAQQQAVSKEMEAVQKTIADEIKVFKLLGGNG